MNRVKQKEYQENNNQAKNSGTCIRTYAARAAGGQRCREKPGPPSARGQGSVWQEQGRTSPSHQAPLFTAEWGPCREGRRHGRTSNLGYDLWAPLCHRSCGLMTSRQRPCSLQMSVLPRDKASPPKSHCHLALGSMTKCPTQVLHSLFTHSADADVKDGSLFIREF